MATWTDITSTCDECAAELRGNRLRPMISSSQFSLNDSMSAVEIMDAKMDQCCGLSMVGTRRDNLLSFRLPDDVSSSHVALVARRMIAGFVGFLNGSNLLDSSLKSVLLWPEGMASIKETDSLWGRVLYAFSISIAQSIKHIYEAVLLADIYEDDDFCPSFQSFVAECSHSAEDLHKLWDDLASQLADFSDLRGLISFQRSLLALSQELHSFLRSTIMSLRAEKPDNNNGDSSGSNSTVNQTASTAPTNALLQFRRACEAVVSQAESLGEAPTATSQGSLESMVFRSELGRLHQVGPVKNDPELPFEECILVLSSIARQLVQTIDAMQSLHSTTVLSFDHVLSFCSQVSSGRKMHLLARSTLVVCLQDAVGTNLTSLLLNSMDLRGIPPLIGSNHATSRDWVAGSVSLAAWELLKTFTISRNRLFHRLENLLSLWGGVATEALILDEELQRSLAAAATSSKQHWFSSWATLYVTAAMDLYFQVLSEMRILELHELDYFYWYWDYVSAAHCHSLEKLRSMRYELDVAVFNSEKNAAKGKKAVQPAIPRPLPLNSEDLVFMGRGQVCKGMFRLVVLLKQCGAIRAVAHAYTSCSEVFARRFRAFQSIVNPTPLSHQDFLDTLRQNSDEGNSSIDLQALLSSASICFQNAKKCFEEARKTRCLNDWQEQQAGAIVGETSLGKEAVILTKVAIANSLVLSKLKSVLGDGAAAGVEPGRVTVSSSGYHPHFSVSASAT